MLAAQGIIGDGYIRSRGVVARGCGQRRCESGVGEVTDKGAVAVVVIVPGDLAARPGAGFEAASGGVGVGGAV